MASLGIFNIFFVAILGWLGDTIGDIIFFCIGRYGLKFLQKKSMVEKEKRENILHKIEILVEKNFLLSLIFIKFTPYAPMIALPYLGSLKKISASKFVFTTAILSLPVPLTVAIFGYHIQTIQIIFNKIPENFRIPSIILLIIFLIIIGFFVYKISQKYIKNFQKKIDVYIENSENHKK